MNTMKKQEIEKNLKDLEKIFPNFIGITNNWLSYAMTHGHEQSKFEKNNLLKFYKIMKTLGVTK